MDNITLSDREMDEVSRQSNLSKLEILGIIGVINTMRSNGRAMARRSEDLERRYGPEI